MERTEEHVVIERSASLEDCRSSVSQGFTWSRRTQSVGERRYGGLSFSEYSASQTAAAGVISRSHPSYDAMTLTDFVTKNFPEIPPEARPYLVIGVAAGAQHAAIEHHYAEDHSNADVPRRKQRAEPARCALAVWSKGLRHLTVEEAEALERGNRSIGAGVMQSISDLKRTSFLSTDVPPAAVGLPSSPPVVAPNVTVTSMADQQRFIQTSMLNTDEGIVTLDERIERALLQNVAAAASYQDVIEVLGIMNRTCTQKFQWRICQ